MQETQNLKLKTYDFGVDDTDDFVNGVAGSADSNMHILDKAITEKVLLNGTTTNVNFKRNKIVQDGLVLNPTTEISDTGNFTLFVDINTATDGTIIDQMGINSESKSSGWKLEYRNGNYVFLYYDTSGLVITTNIPSTKHKHVALIKNGVEFILYTQNHNQTQIKVVNYCVFNKKINYTRVYNCYGYKRNLTSQEIAHNISVLNNPSSVNAIETTDSSSVKTSFLLSSNATHVEMPNGKTLRDFAYQTLDWEKFTSDGSDISVTNGKEAWVRNAKISGNTVKNLCPTINTSNVKDSGLSFVTIDSMKITVSCDGAQASNPDVKYIYGNIEPNKQYILRYLVYENTSNNIFDLNVGTSAIGVFSTTVRVGAGFTGVNEVVVTSKTDLSAATSLIRTYFPTSLVGKISYSVALFEVGAKTSDKIVPFGLTSTQAVISNNNLKYPF